MIYNSFMTQGAWCEIHACHVRCSGNTRLHNRYVRLTQNFEMNILWENRESELMTFVLLSCPLTIASLAL